MSDRAESSDALLAACSAVLREVAEYPITPERLEAALPLVKEMIAAIRMMDEVDVDGIEPATAFHTLR
jgi:hypothetical protein